MHDNIHVITSSLGALFAPPVIYNYHTSHDLDGPCNVATFTPRQNLPSYVSCEGFDSPSLFQLVVVMTTCTAQPIFLSTLRVDS